MALRSIEIICKPCLKCERAEMSIKRAIESLERINRTKYNFEFIKTTNLAKAERFSANIALKPFIIINGKLEYTGNVPDEKILRLKLLDIICT